MKLWKSFAVAIGFVSAASPIPAALASPQEHAVIVHFNYGSTDLGPLFALEGKLESAISKAGVGEYDGNEVTTDGSDGYLYMYGPSADRLFNVVKPILSSVPFMHGASITKRYGPPADGTKKVTLVLDP